MTIEEFEDAIMELEAEARKDLLLDEVISVYELRAYALHDERHLEENEE